MRSGIVGENIEGAWSTCEDYIQAQIAWLSYSGKHNLSRIGRNTAKSVRGVCVSPSTTVTTSGELKSYYTKAEADDRFALKNNVYTKTEVEALIGSLTDQITALQNALPPTTKVTVKVVYNSTPQEYQSDAANMAWIEVFGKKITGTSTFYVTTGTSVNWRMKYAGGNISTGFPHSHCKVKVNNQSFTQDSYKICKYVLNGNNIEYQQTGTEYGYDVFPEPDRPKIFKTSLDDSGIEYSIPVPNSNDITIEIDIYTSFYAG